MKVLHLICKKDEGSLSLRGIKPVSGESGVYISCCWDFKFDDAKRLEGGKIYFHETKSERSSLGGNVIEAVQIDLGDGETEYYSPSADDQSKRQKRVMFKFRVSADCRDVKWFGKNHAMSWTSGIIDAG